MKQYDYVMMFFANSYDEAFYLFKSIINEEKQKLITKSHPDVIPTMFEFLNDDNFTQVAFIMTPSMSYNKIIPNIVYMKSNVEVKYYLKLNQISIGGVLVKT